MHLGLIGLGKMGGNMRERIRRAGHEVVGFDRNPEVSDVDTVNADTLAAKGIGYLDCGVSGGVWGLENGYGLMVGGDADHVERAMPIFDALRPEGPREEGFVHAGAVGAGHYAKMVHNGIEYGLMQAYAEGYELLAAKDIVTDVHG